MIFKKIIGRRIYLKKLGLKNATREYSNWLNDPIVNKYLETHQATVADIRKFIQKQLDDPNSLFVGIFDKKTDKHIGNMKLEPIDWNKKNAVFGMLVGDKNYWGIGVGTEAARLLLDYAFDEMGLLEIVLGVLSENKPAIRVYEKVGFRIREIKRNIKRQNGQFSDSLTMSINKKNG